MSTSSIPRPSPTTPTSPNRSVGGLASTTTRPSLAKKRSLSYLMSNGSGLGERSPSHGAEGGGGGVGGGRKSPMGIGGGGMSSPQSLKGLGEEEIDNPEILRSRLAELEQALSSQSTYIHSLESVLRQSSTSFTSSSHPPGNSRPGMISSLSFGKDNSGLNGASGSGYALPTASSSSSTRTLQPSALPHSSPIYDLKQAQSLGVAMGKIGNVEKKSEGEGEMIVDLSEDGFNQQHQEDGDLTKDSLNSSSASGSGPSSVGRSGGSSSGRTSSRRRSMIPVLSNGLAGMTNGNSGGGIMMKSPTREDEPEENGLGGESGGRVDERGSLGKRMSSNLGLSMIPRSRVQSAISNIDAPTASSTARRQSTSAASSSTSRSSSRASNSRGISPSPPDGMLSPNSLHPNSASGTTKAVRANSPVTTTNLSSPIELVNGVGNLSHGGVGTGSATTSKSHLRKPSAGMGASGKVIESLTREVEASKGHLERVKAELRASQRLIGQFTRQTEDLKETKERMRFEAEGLNNVITRKERLLEEVLVRARTAEGNLATQLKERKAMEASTKKQITQMTAELEESQARSMKAEREAMALKDGFKGLKENWAKDMKSLRAEIKATAEDHRKEMDLVEAKNAEMGKVLGGMSKSQKGAIEDIQQERRQLSEQVSSVFKPQLEALKASLDAEDSALDKTRAEVENLTAEITRIKRLMRANEGS